MHEERITFVSVSSRYSIHYSIFHVVKVQYFKLFCPSIMIVDRYLFRLSAMHLESDIKKAVNFHIIYILLLNYNLVIYYTEHNKSS
jgi:hypothetical protein